MPASTGITVTIISVNITREDKDYRTLQLNMDGNVVDKKEKNIKKNSSFPPCWFSTKFLALITYCNFKKSCGYRVLSRL